MRIRITVQTVVLVVAAVAIATIAMTWFVRQAMQRDTLMARMRFANGGIAQLEFPRQNILVRGVDIRGTKKTVEAAINGVDIIVGEYEAKSPMESIVAKSGDMQAQDIAPPRPEFEMMGVKAMNGTIAVARDARVYVALRETDARWDDATLCEVLRGITLRRSETPAGPAESAATVTCNTGPISRFAWQSGEAHIRDINLEAMPLAMIVAFGDRQFRIGQWDKDSELDRAVRAGSSSRHQTVIADSPFSIEHIPALKRECAIFREGRVYVVPYLDSENDVPWTDDMVRSVLGGIRVRETERSDGK